MCILYLLQVTVLLVMVDDCRWLCYWWWWNYTVYHLHISSIAELSKIWERKNILLWMWVHCTENTSTQLIVVLAFWIAITSVFTCYYFASYGNIRLVQELRHAKWCSNGVIVFLAVLVCLVCTFSAVYALNGDANDPCTDGLKFKVHIRDPGEYMASELRVYTLATILITRVHFSSYRCSQFADTLFCAWLTVTHSNARQFSSLSSSIKQIKHHITKNCSQHHLEAIKLNNNQWSCSPFEVVSVPKGDTDIKCNFYHNWCYTKFFCVPETLSCWYCSSLSHSLCHASSFSCVHYDK